MGALPTQYAANGAGVKGADYFSLSGFKEKKGYPRKVLSNPLSQDQKIAERLWQVLETLTAVQYPN